MIIVFIITIFLLIALSVLLYMERTSYAIQGYFFNNGEVHVDELRSLVQDRPGIRYREISDEISMTRKDIISTLRVMENTGEVRTVEVGNNVRFYPTVGSFVDKDLVLNRQELKIVRSLLAESFLSEKDLMEETGLGLNKLRRTESLLDLKGVITVKTRSDTREYSLSRRQRRKVNSYLEGRDQ